MPPKTYKACVMACIDEKSRRARCLRVSKYAPRRPNNIFIINRLTATVFSGTFDQRSCVHILPN